MYCSPRPRGASGRLGRQTVRVVGAEELLLSQVVRRVASAVRRRVRIVPAPVWALRALGALTEWTTRVPLVATAQVRMLAERVSRAAPAAAELSAAPGRSSRSGTRERATAAKVWY